MDRFLNAIAVRKQGYRMNEFTLSANREFISAVIIIS
jgi:hypothetical protein